MAAAHFEMLSLGANTALQQLTSLCSCFPRVLPTYTVVAEMWYNCSLPFQLCMVQLAGLRCQAASTSDLLFWSSLQIVSDVKTLTLFESVAMCAMGSTMGVVAGSAFPEQPVLAELAV